MRTVHSLINTVRLIRRGQSVSWKEATAQLLADVGGWWWWGGVTVDDKTPGVQRLFHSLFWQWDRVKETPLLAHSEAKQEKKGNQAAAL